MKTLNFFKNIKENTQHYKENGVRITTPKMREFFKNLKALPWESMGGSLWRDTWYENQEIILYASGYLSHPQTVFIDVYIKKIDGKQGEKISYFSLDYEEDLNFFLEQIKEFM